MTDVVFAQVYDLFEISAHSRFSVCLSRIVGDRSAAQSRIGENRFMSLGLLSSQELGIVRM